jgi:hypothetical protein
MNERYYVKGLEVWRRPDPGGPETVRLAYLICTCSPIAGPSGAELIAKVLEASELIAKQLKVRRGEMYDGG